MDFESPDVAKEFPGLYASETMRRSQSKECDDSDDEKSFRKDLLGKKKEKKESKKDKGYVPFAGESSGEDADEVKSPDKKKNKSSFLLRGKDKKEKSSKSKETKEKKEEKEKISKKEEKEKISKKEEKLSKKDSMRKDSKDVEKVKKKEKKEIKLLKKKDKKKKTVEKEIKEEKPLFGVPLQIAVERSKSHDDIELPVIVRECIDYIEDHGLSCESIYRTSGVKSKVRHLKSQYNAGEKVYLYEHEPHIVASLLKQFLRDLPEPILTNALSPKFEEAAALKNEQKKIEVMQKLLNELPKCNCLLLSWIFTHMQHVIKREKINKMNLQNVSIVLSPTMQISHNVLQSFFTYSDAFFKGTVLKRYVPPIEVDSSRLSLELPDSPTSIAEELSRQENVLNILHAELNTGLRDPQKEEQLWEIQRVVTQLKRKLRFFRQIQDTPEHQVVEEKREPSSQNVISPNPPASEPSVAPVAQSEETVLQIPQDLSYEETVKKHISTSPMKSDAEVANMVGDTMSDNETQIVTEPSCEDKVDVKDNMNSQENIVVAETEEQEDLSDLIEEERMLRLQSEELYLLGDELRRKINSEKLETERLKMDIHEYQQLYKYKRYAFDSSENSSSDSDDTSASDEEDEDLSTVLENLMAINKQLEEKNRDVSKAIQDEREACLNIKVQMKMLYPEGKCPRQY